MLRRTDRKSSRLIGTAAIAGVLALAAACSSNASSNGSNPGGGQSAGSSKSAAKSWPSSPGVQLPASYPTLQGYKDAVQQATAPIKWGGPTAPAKAPKKGYLAAIGCARTFSGCYVGADAAVAAAKAAGWDGGVTNVANPKDLDQAVQTAIIKGATAIMLQGIDQRNIPVGLSQARAKHIPVVSTFQENEPTADGVDYEVNPNANALGAILADAMIAKNDGKVNVLFLNDNEYGLPVLVLKALKAQLDACTICQVHYAPAIDFTADTVSTSLPGRLVAALRNDPSINSLAVGYDPPTNYLVPALNAAGLRNKAQFYSQLGLTLNFIQENNNFAYDAVAPLAWSGWAAVDEIFRYLNNQPFVDENIPNQLFGADNISGASSSFDGSSAGYKDEYLKLWGVS